MPLNQQDKIADRYNFLENGYNLNGLINESESGWFGIMQNVGIDKLSLS